MKNKYREISKEEFNLTMLVNGWEIKDLNAIWHVTPEKTIPHVQITCFCFPIIDNKPSKVYKSIAGKPRYFIYA